MNGLTLMLASMVLCTVGCTQMPADSPPPGTDALAEAQVESHMLDHFADATLAQTALINGDIHSLRKHARSLASHTPVANLPVGGAPFVARFQELAGKAATASDRQQIATALAGMAGQCGACHSHFNVMTGIPVQTEMPDTSGAAGMAGHIWAADRLWEGLIAPSDEAWMQGAITLRHAPLTLPAKIADVDPEMIAPLRGQIRDIGQAAQRTFDRDEQVSLYGRLLPLCAACHDNFR